MFARTLPLTKVDFGIQRLNIAALCPQAVLSDLILNIVIDFVQLSLDDFGPPSGSDHGQ